MDRRSLLSAGILAPLGLAAGLAGCKQPDPNSPGPLTVNNVANDAILVSRGLQAAWSEISQLTTILAGAFGGIGGLGPRYPNSRYGGWGLSAVALLLLVVLLLWLPLFPTPPAGP
jgi:hypothetical protein